MGRLERLTHSAEEAEKAEEELELIQGQVSSFSEEQNAKSRKVLASISGNSDKSLLTMTFKDWAAHYRQYVADKEFHQKFQLQLEDARVKLWEFKTADKQGASKMMMGQGKAKDAMLLDETLKALMKYVRDEKND